MDIHNATSLQGLGDGHTPSCLQDGQQTNLCGLEAAHASRSRVLERDSEQKTSATCGQKCSGSSASASLQRSLANRLRQRLGVSGSDIYSLTWKVWDMPGREPICALRASARTTSGSGCSGWPTADAHGFECKDVFRMMERRQECRDRTGNGNGFGLTLGQLVQLAGWPTPNTMDTIERNGLRPSRLATNRTGGYMSEILAGYCTPQAGPPQSSAETEKRAVLHPELPRWLMGYPPEWCDCAVMAMQSFPRSRRNS